METIQRRIETIMRRRGEINELLRQIIRLVVEDKENPGSRTHLVPVATAGIRLIGS